MWVDRETAARLTISAWPMPRHAAEEGRDGCHRAGPVHVCVYTECPGRTVLGRAERVR